MFMRTIIATIALIIALPVSAYVEFQGFSSGKVNGANGYGRANQLCDNVSRGGVHARMCRVSELPTMRYVTKRNTLDGGNGVYAYIYNDVADDVMDENCRMMSNANTSNLNTATIWRLRSSSANRGWAVLRDQSCSTRRRVACCADIEPGTSRAVTVPAPVEAFPQ